MTSNTRQRSITDQPMRRYCASARARGAFGPTLRRTAARGAGLAAAPAAAFSFSSGAGSPRTAPPAAPRGRIWTARCGSAGRPGGARAARCPAARTSPQRTAAPPPLSAPRTPAACRCSRCHCRLVGCARLRHCIGVDAGRRAPLLRRGVRVGTVGERRVALASRHWRCAVGKGIL